MRKLLALFILSCTFLTANSFKVATGAGYKKPVQKIIKLYEKKNNKIDSFYGNMRQISAQAKHTNIALIIGDKNFLKNKSKLDFENFLKIGEGKAVLAFSKKAQANSLNDLKKQHIKRVFMPHPKKAIYGIAAKQILENTKLFSDINSKLFVTATVPQVATYLITNEIDAGFINLTSALANKQKLGSYVLIDEKYYSKINIVAASTKSCNQECKKFINFLQTQKAKEIFKKYGL